MRQARGARTRPLTFFGLLFAVSLPLWVLGDSVDLELLPGLPIGALMFVFPALTASLLRFLDGGGAGVRALWARGVDCRGLGGVRLVAAAILLNPLVFALSYGIGRLMGSGAPGFTFSISEAATLGAVFLVAAVAEEVGWSGYALDGLQAKKGAVASSVILGLVWAVWHWPVLYQAERAWDWIAWWSIWTLCARVIMVWFYNRAGGSVFIVALYHAASNLSWQLYPVHGSYFEPSITAVVTMPIAVALVRVNARHRRSTTDGRTDGSSRPTSCAH